MKIEPSVNVLIFIVILEGVMGLLAAFIFYVGFEAAFLHAFLD